MSFTKTTSMTTHGTVGQTSSTSPAAQRAGRTDCPREPEISANYSAARWSPRSAVFYSAGSTSDSNPQDWDTHDWTCTPIAWKTSRLAVIPTRHSFRASVTQP